MTPLLQTKEIRKTFTVRGSQLRGPTELDALRGVSLGIPQGRTFGLVGESGSGKTTLGRIVLGLETPTAGTVLHRGRDVTHLRGHERRRFQRDAQAVFQDPLGALPHHMRIRRILEEPFRIHRVAANDRISAEDLLDEVRLPAHFATRYPHELSGGQCQRVVIARALALRPSLVVCDEPVSALDVSIQAHILELLRSLQASHNLTYLFISHDLGVIRYVSDMVGVMFLGRLVEVGPPDEIYRCAFHPYTRALLAAIPSVRRPTRTVALPAASTPVLGGMTTAGCRFRGRCPMATAECAVTDPPLREVAPGHWAACHHAEKVPDRIRDTGAADAQP